MVGNSAYIYWKLRFFSAVREIFWKYQLKFDEVTCMTWWYYYITIGHRAV